MAEVASVRQAESWLNPKYYYLLFQVEIMLNVMFQKLKLCNLMLIN